MRGSTVSLGIIIMSTASTSIYLNFMFIGSYPTNINTELNVNDMVW